MHILLIISLLIEKMDLKLLIVENKVEKTLNLCFENIAQNAFLQNETVLYSNWDLPIHLTVQQKFKTIINNNQSLNLERSPLNLLIKFSVYVLLVKAQQLDSQLNILSVSDNWNSHSKFLIVLIDDNKITKKTLGILAKYHVYNVVIIELNTFFLYTYHPYIYENLHDPNLNIEFLGSCFEKNFTTRELYKSKVPKLWRNTTLIIAHMVLAPYIIDVKEEERGIEVDLVKLMKWYLKCDFKYSQEDYFDWGEYIRVNHSYDGPAGAVYERTADFTLGYFHTREEERLLDFDTTFSYMDDDISWAVPTAPHRSHWENLLNIFSAQIWTLTIFSLSLSTICWYFMSKYSPEERFNFIDSLIMVYLLFLSLPMTREPKCVSMRLLFFITFIFCFVIGTGWKSYLIYSLTHEISAFQVSNVEELIESDLIIGIYKELIDLYGSDGSIQGNYIYNYADRDLCDASDACSNRMAFEGDLATISTKRILRYDTRTQFRGPDGRDLVYIFEEPVGKDYVVQFYQKGHPMFARINDLLMWICTSGFIHNLDNRIDHISDLTNHKNFFATFEFNVLNIRQTQSMFFVLLFGHVLSCLVFISELVMDKFHMRHIPFKL